jgi:hypothetical protein
MAKSGTPKDELRTLLDKLAVTVVTETLESSDATAREKSDVLKVAGGWWGVSRKNEPGTKPPSAWDKYQQAMNGRGLADAEAHEA